MAHALAFLHTAQVHVPTFERLLGDIAPRLHARHLVRADLLADARTLGVGDAGLAARVHAAMLDAAAGGARVVVCTCSTIGDLAERTPTHGAFEALRIDRAMARQAVRRGPRVLVVAALESTLEPTLALLHDAAAEAGLPLAPRPLAVADAWAHFEAGDTARYIEVLAAAIRANVADIDVVVLAQASMAPVEGALAASGPPVLCSPEPGVRHAAERAALRLRASGSALR